MSIARIFKRNFVDLPPFKSVLTLFTNNIDDLKTSRIQSYLQNAHQKAAENALFDPSKSLEENLSIKPLRITSFDLQVETEKPTKVQMQIIKQGLRNTGLSDEAIDELDLDRSLILIDWNTNNVSIGSDILNITKVLSQIR